MKISSGEECECECVEEEWKTGSWIVEGGILCSEEVVWRMGLRLVVEVLLVVLVVGCDISCCDQWIGMEY